MDKSNGGRRLPVAHAAVAVIATATIALVSACATSPITPVAAAKDATATVRSTELRRLDAVTRADVASLRELMSPQLTYCHSSGRCESGASLIGRIASGELRYRSLQSVDMQIERAGGLMLLHGTLDMQVDNAGQALRARLSYLAVYEPVARGWQLRAYQSTRVP